MSRYRREEHEGKDRWLVPYADFLTLLLALFIVLYAASHGGERKSQALTASLISAFGKHQAGSGIVGMAPGTQLIERRPVRKSLPEPVAPVSAGQRDSRHSVSEAETSQPLHSGEARRRQEDRMEAIARDLMAAFAPFTSLLENGQVKLIRSTAGLGVEINARVLFAPGQSSVQEGSGRVLEAVAHALTETDHRIQVEGHTDSIPIVTEKFPSNWELSAMRASSVVRLLIGYGVGPARLTALGYGENRPVESNDTEAGRMRNRRVTVLILSDLTDGQSGDFPETLPEILPETLPTHAPDQRTEPAPAISSV